MNNTLPLICNPTAEQEALLDELGEQFISEDYASSVKAYLRLGQLRAEICAESTGYKGRLMGSVYTVRDMLHIVDALDDDGLLRYYGISYGTILGDTFAEMFPHRVGKIVNDGNVNPLDYYFGKSVSILKVSMQELNKLVATPFFFCRFSSHGLSRRMCQSSKRLCFFPR